MEGRSDGGGGGGGGGGGAGGGAGSSSRFISQLFWPEHCLSLGGRRGYLIGWNTAAFKCLVVTLVTVDAETGLPTLDQTERALEILSSDPRCRTLNGFCSSEGAPPTVLGEWLPNGGVSSMDYHYDGGAASAAAEAAAARRQSANIWLTVGQKAGRPVLRSLYCCGCAYRTCCYVVFYRPCNPDVLEYLPTIKRNASAYASGGEDGGDSGGASVDSKNGSGSPVSSFAGAADGGPGAAAAATGHHPSGGHDPVTAKGASAFGAGDADAGVGRDGDTGSHFTTSTSTSTSSRGAQQGAATTVATSNKTQASSSSGGAVVGRGGPVVLRRGRIGHGTALVSPSAREGGNPSGVARDATGLLMGGGAGTGGDGAEDPTDLDLAIRQVSCAATLERALRSILRDIVVDDKRTTRQSAPSAAAAAVPYPDGGGEPTAPQVPGNDAPVPPPASDESSAAKRLPVETAMGGPAGAETGEGEGIEETETGEHGFLKAPAVTGTSSAAAAGESSKDGAAADASSAPAAVPITGKLTRAEEERGGGGGGGGGGDGDGEAGRSGRRSVSFADQASQSSPLPPSPHADDPAGEEDEGEDPELLAAVEPSAPPSILRGRRGPERGEDLHHRHRRRRGGSSGNSGTVGAGGGPVPEGDPAADKGDPATGEGGGEHPFSRGKPPVFQKSRREARSSSGGGRRRKTREQNVGDGGGGGYGDRSRSPTGGVHVGIPGRVVLDGCCLVLRIVSMAAILVVRVLEAEIVWTPLANEPWRSPSDASLLCAHLLSRLKGALSLPFRLSKCWRERHQPAERRVEGLVSLSHWLFGLAADASLGIVACALLLRHTGAAARAAHKALHLLHVDVLREELEWLNYFPAGFKLNVPLTHTLGSLTLIGMDAYSSIVGQLAQWEGATMKTIAICAAGGGLTTALAVSHDAFRLLTLHTATAHTAFAALHNLHSSLLGSLWQLFRGRKRNVLRCRVDTCMYDAGQLLLGTLVFTVLSFLTPTISVYYTFFCIVQAIAVGVQAVLMCLFVLINELPVYQFLLLLTSPGRLLSGFQLQVLDAALPSSAPAPTAAGSASALRQRGGGGSSSFLHDASPGQWEGGANMVYFQLKRCRAPASALFQPYADRARHAVRRYPPAAVAKSIISGKPLPDLGFRDFVTVRGGSGRGPRGVDGEDGGGAVDGESAAGGGLVRTLEVGLIIDVERFPAFRMAFEPGEVNWDVDPGMFRLTKEKAEQGLRELKFASGSRLILSDAQVELFTRKMGVDTPSQAVAKLEMHLERRGNWSSFFRTPGLERPPMCAWNMVLRRSATIMSIMEPHDPWRSNMDSSTKAGSSRYIAWHIRTSDGDTARSFKAAKHRYIFHNQPSTKVCPLYISTLDSARAMHPVLFQESDGVVPIYVSSNSKSMAHNCAQAVEGKDHHISAGLIDMGVADSDSHTAFSKNPDTVTSAFIDLLYLMDASVIVCTSSSFAGLRPAK
eukprot:g5916.t1